MSARAVPRANPGSLEFGLVAVLAALVLHTVPSGAIVYVMPTDESMVDRSPIIVFGEVLNARPGTDPDSPTTDYLFAVEEVLKGFVAGSGIMVRQPGGVAAGDLVMSVVGLPVLAEGNRVLLFLHPEENGAHGIVEYGLGMFFEARVGDRVFLLREPSLRGEVVLAGGQSASDRVRRRGYRDAAAFRHWIGDRATGAERPADYLARELPEHPTALVSPFRLTRFPCAAGPLPARWRNFDRGESVGFEVLSRGQPGIAGGGLPLVRAAMQVWNADAGSNVNLEFARTIATAPRLGELDGDNSITFEDPHDEIEGSYRAGEGGVLAVTSTWSTCGAPHSVGGLRVSEIPQANMTTQDGYQRFLRQLDSQTAERAFQNVMAHELGHALGIAHPCDSQESNCNTDHELSGALMWWRSDPHRDLGTALHSDDRAAVRRLYPDESYTPAPDLVVESPASTESSVAPGGDFSFAATVRNRGDDRSRATTLRYYRSSDSRITTSDTPVGTDRVRALSASATDRQSIDQQAPATPGTYYYGACVDSVSSESDTTNNCSSGVPISVAGAAASCSGDTCLLQGQRFRVKARYSKDGAPSQSAGAIEAALADSAGLFSAESGSPELLVRIVNQCRTTGYWEVYAGVASDADFSVAVRHVETNELKWFRTRDRQSVGDTEAFACTPSDDSASPTDPVSGTGDAGCSGVTCLLQEDRFRVKSWYAHDGGSSQAADAIAVDVGESAGLFAFDSGNPELLVRIADTCSTSGYWTVYAGTASDADFSVAIRDTETNELKWLRSQGGQSAADAEAFPCGGSDDGMPPGDPDDSPCSGDTCLLQGERFRVKARYSKAGAPSQSAGAVEAALADSAGLFSGESDSPELLVRIVNQCRTTGYWEVYGGVASDADFSVAVRHVETNELKWFRVRDGQSVTDTEGFACTDGDAEAPPGGAGGASEDAACSGVTCLLQADRFRVKSWYTRDGASSQAADAISVDLGQSAGLFTFDSAGSELLVRITDNCGTSGYWEVHAGAASAADFRVAVRKIDTNELKWFRSRNGQSVADTEAFACSAADTSEPDLVVSSASVSDNSLDAGATFTLSATVQNQGDGRSPSTTLRYYRSSNSTIGASDAEVGADPVGALSASDSSAQSIDLTAPSTAGTYYYGACADSVSGESDTGNNCSNAVSVTVTSVTEYKYDDGNTSTSSSLNTVAGDVHEQEFAQRFRLSGSGTVNDVTLCVARRENVGNSNQLPLKLTFYRDSGGRPGSTLGTYTGSVTSPPARRWRCSTLSGDLTRQQLSGGSTWIGVSWLSSTGMAMMVDDSATGSTKLSVRARIDSNSNWIAWQDHPTSSVKVFLIRLGVNHGGSTATTLRVHGVAPAKGGRISYYGGASR